MARKRADRSGLRLVPRPEHADAHVTLGRARAALIRAAADTTEPMDADRLASCMLHAMSALAQLRSLPGSGKAIDLAEQAVRREMGTR